MRLFVYFCLLALCAARLPAAPATSELVSWPDHGPYRTVGDPGFRVVRMPVPVIEALQRMLQEDSAKWEITRLGGFPDRRGLVLEVSSRHDGLYLLRKQGRWTNLCAPAAVPSLNGVVCSLHPTDLQDEAKLEKYLNEILLLHYGNAVLLTKYFGQRRLTEDRISYWLGNEKKPEALRALCHDPVVDGNQGGVTIQCNVLLGDGSAERWTFHLQVDKAVRVEAIDRVQLRKKGSFYYALLIASWDKPALPKWAFRINRMTQELPRNKFHTVIGSRSVQLSPSLPARVTS